MPVGTSSADGSLEWITYRGRRIAHLQLHESGAMGLSRRDTPLYRLAADGVVTLAACPAQMSARPFRSALDSSGAWARVLRASRSSSCSQPSQNLGYMMPQPAPLHAEEADGAHADPGKRLYE